MSSPPHAADATPAPQLKVVLFVLKSLGCGKAVSQACHAIHSMTSRLEQEYFQQFPMSSRCEQYKQWCEKPSKIVLAATAEQLMALASRDDVEVVVDQEGDKYVPPGTLVCVAVLPKPADECRELGQGYKLL